MEILNKNCEPLRVDKDDSGLVAFALYEAGFRMASASTIY
jgi:hypothetical protein